MRKAVAMAVCMFFVLVLSGVAWANTEKKEKVELKDIPAIVLGVEMPEGHQKIESPACMECHKIKADATTAATERFLLKKGALKKEDLWAGIVEFYGHRQTCTIATVSNNAPYVTTVDFALDSAKKVMYAFSETGTRKLGQVKKNENIALEYHDSGDARSKLFRCLQMRGKARVVGAGDPLFEEGLNLRSKLE